MVHLMPSRRLPNSFLTPDPGTIFTSNPEDITDDLWAVVEDALADTCLEDITDELEVAVEDAPAVACLVTSKLGMVTDNALAASCLEN